MRAKIKVPSKGKEAIAAGVDAVANLAGLKHPLSAPVLFYFIAILLPISGQVGPLFITGVRLILLLYILPLSIQLLRGQYGRFLLTDALFILHSFWIVVALFYNNPAYALEQSGSTIVEFWGAYVLGRAFIKSREDFIAMIRLIAFVVVCCAPFAIYETTTGVSPILKFIDSVPGIFGAADVDASPRLGLERVQMMFPHPIHFGLFCASLLPMCWVGMQGIYSNKVRLLISITLVASGSLALSSGALLAMVLQFGLIGWAWAFDKYEKRWAILLGLFIAAYIVIDVTSNRDPVNVFLNYATFSSQTGYIRLIIFEAGMNNVWSHPILGIGLNDWARPSWLGPSVDNFWLLAAMRFGIPGFMTLAVGYGYALWTIGRRDFSTDRVLWQFRRAWVFSFMGLSFTLTTVHVWHNIYSFVFFLFGTGIWMIYEEPRYAAGTEGRPSKTKSRRAANKTPTISREERNIRLHSRGANAQASRGPSHNRNPDDGGPSRKIVPSHSIQRDTGPAARAAPEPGKPTQKFTRFNGPKDTMKSPQESHKETPSYTRGTHQSRRRENKEPDKEE